MARFIFFTKTKWSEQPRLRHQLANMLCGRGHEVVFFERPASLLLPARGAREASNLVNRGARIKFLETRQLVNHKLRLSPAVHYLNAVVEISSIRRSLAMFNPGPLDIVVNFNYDYFFLRKVFANLRLITIINDDFWCRAIGGWEWPLRWALKRTCLASDRVLCVSRPLVEDTSQYKGSHLFLPWSERSYSAPLTNVRRRVLLFWGFVNDRLNWEYVLSLSRALRLSESSLVIRLIGPVERLSGYVEAEIALSGNIEICPPCAFDEIRFDEVLASFIPYRAGNKADDVTTLPNKALPMLSMGLPLIITGMPNCIDGEFVIRLGIGSMAHDLAILNDLPNRLSSLQSAIASFVDKNSADARYAEFMEHCYA
jgi:hypothetical protein